MVKKLSRFVSEWDYSFCSHPTTDIETLAADISLRSGEQQLVRGSALFKKISTMSLEHSFTKIKEPRYAPFHIHLSLPKNRGSRIRGYQLPGKLGTNWEQIGNRISKTP